MSIIVILIGGSAGGLIGSLGFSLVSNQISTLVGVLVNILIVLVYSGLGELNPQVIDVVRWNWRGSMNQDRWIGGLGGGIFGGFIFSLIIGLIGAANIDLITGIVVGLTGGLVVGMIFILLIVLIGGLELQVLEHRARPNEGIQRSAKSALLVGLGSGSVFGLILGTVIELIFGSSSGLVVGIFVALLVGLAGGLGYGGGMVIKHYTLRLFLHRSTGFPLNITAFLDSCAARGLVQRVGGGWRFPHNLIRDYFAELEIETNNNA